MTNHVHLAIQVADVPLPKIVQNLSFRYTRYVNRRKKRYGHLFQGRYKAILVDSESYLSELVRYIHLNPCRAGLVAHAADYPWSGHRAYLGKEELPWLTTDWVLSQFSRQTAAARRQYAAFVARGLREPYPKAFHFGGDDDSRILGEDRFVEKVMGRDPPKVKRPSIAKIVQAVCQLYEIRATELPGSSRQRSLAEARGVVAWLVAKNQSGTLTQLAEDFHRDVSAISLAVRNIDKKMQESKTFYRTVTSLNKSITQG